MIGHYLLIFSIIFLVFCCVISALFWYACIKVARWEDETRNRWDIRR